MTRVAPKKFISRVAPALALLTAPFVAVERAVAACDQTAPVNDVIVTCSGATNNANPPNGWGTGVETGDTINVQVGASVGAAAGGTGLFVNSGTVNNAGIVAGDLVGIKATNGITVTNMVGGAIATSLGNVIDATNVDLTNNGLITHIANANPGGAIHATGTATVTNTGDGTTTGVILSKDFGIDAGTVIVRSNTGKIQTGAAGTAIHATNTVTVQSNAGDGITTGLISGGLFGIDAGTVVVNSNTGLIEATANGGKAIQATTNADITSAGVIRANGNGSSAIASDGTATVHNSGTISANGNAGFAIFGSGDVNVDNSNSIQATGVGGTAIASNTGKVTVNNLSTGTITAERFTILGISVDVTNAHVIEATGGLSTPTVAIEASDAKVTNSGRISALNTNGSNLAIAASGDANVVNSGTIEAPGADSIGISTSLGTATVHNNLGGSITGGKFGIKAAALDVTNAFGATISGGTSGVEGITGSVTNAGTITGGTNSVLFSGNTGTNTLTLQTGSVLNGDAVGSTAGATNKLILQGSGIASNNFFNFNSLDVQASGVWVWNSGASGPIGQTTVSSGTLAVDNLLFSPVTVNSGGTLAGHGTVNAAVSVTSGGVLAPGAAVPFSTLTVQGNVDFASNAIYRVNVGAAGQNDKLVLAGGGAATLTGGTVNVRVGGTFAPSIQYTILTATGGFNGTTFGGVLPTNLAFLTPTLSYNANDVFLTLVVGNGTGTIGFANAALTPNQRAVAGALDRSPASNPLVTALLTQSFAGARQAFDALSGEVYGSLHNAQAEEAQFARSGMLGRMRQMSYSGAPGELGALGFGGPQLAYASGDAYAADVPVKAAPGRDASHGLTFWAQGLGGWGHSDGDGNAASLTNRFGGFLSGVDGRFGETWRAGLVAGYVRSDLNVSARSSSAGIDSVQFGGYAAGRVGAFNVRGGASYSVDSIDTSRSIFFPGFTDQAKARFHGNVGQVFGEVGYGMAFDRVAVEPIAGLAYVHLHDNSFLESGGAAALSGSGANESTGYSTLGLRAATALPLANGTVLVPRATLQWQYAFGDVTPGAALAFQGTGTAFSIAGVPIARNIALVEGGFDWRFSPQAKLGAFYQGELAAHAQTHAVKGAFTWDF